MEQKRKAAPEQKRLQPLFARLDGEHVATLGQGGSCPPPIWMLCPPNVPLAIFLHISFPSPVSLHCRRPNVSYYLITAMLEYSVTETVDSASRP